jgi:hypothetical protein
MDDLRVKAGMERVKLESIGLDKTGCGVDVVLLSGAICSNFLEGENMDQYPVLFCFLELDFSVI